MEKSANLEKWKSLEEELGSRTDNAEDILSALRELYSLYTPRLAGWLGGLYDSNLGGFYYSNSARDNHGYLPDIESTSQALNFLGSSGVISSYEELPAWMRERTAFFIKYLQDPYSGFFYNLQWDVELANVHPTRLARDMSAAHNVAHMLGFKLERKPEVPAEYRGILKINDEDTLPHLRSKDSFRAYLESFDPKNDVYRLASAVVSQHGLLLERDLVDVAYQFIERMQNTKTGLFENLENPSVIDSYYTISMFYMAAGKPLKHVKRAIPTILNSLRTERVTNAPYAQHVWRASSNVIDILRGSNDGYSKREADEIVAEIMKSAPSMIRTTSALLSKFQKPDGSFSYNEDSSSAFSQGLPVARCGSNEGDVNATVICTIGTSRAIFRALDLQNLYPPILSGACLADFLGAVKPPSGMTKSNGE